MVEAAGFREIPSDLPNFLKLLQALKAKGTPCGFALGNAVGDANAWCHWVVWAHGGKMVDENNKVVINSKETIVALEYAKAMYETFIPGTLSWLDPSNNKAFLAGEISLTLNGISIYYVAKTSKDAAVKALTPDIYHTPMPVGPVGRSTELNVFTPCFVFKYSKYPNAAREYLRFMLEKEQYEAWQKSSLQPGLDRRPEAHAFPRHSRPYCGRWLRGPAGGGLRRRDRGLRHGEHGSGGGLRRIQPRGRSGQG
jgi:multiple sugar transport system substrate-binding protein